jgi:hypothetical protein
VRADQKMSQPLPKGVVTTMNGPKVAKFLVG